MALTMRHIQTSLDKLSRLMPAQPNLETDREFSLKETIFMMAPKLIEMKALGFKTKELITALADQEIIIKTPTLNRYLCDYQAGREKTPDQRAAAQEKEIRPTEKKSAQALASSMSEPEVAVPSKSSSFESAKRASGVPGRI